MVTNIKLNNDTVNNIWTYSPQIDSESGNTLILNTANKFLDKNIKIILPGTQQTQTSASGFSLSISNVYGNSEVIVGSMNSNGYYPVTANNLSITGTFSASTAGLFNSDSGTDPDVDNASVGKIAAGSCIISGGELSTSGFNKQDLALTLSNGNDTTLAANSYALINSKDTTSYPYYFKITGSTPAVSGNTTARVSAITDTHTAGYIPPKAETNFRTEQSATPSVSVNSTEKSAYIGLKRAAISASVLVNSEGSASMSAGGFTPLAEGNTSNYYVTLNTTAGSAEATAGISTAGYAVDQTGSDTTSVPVDGDGTKLYIPTNSITGSVIDLSVPSVTVSGAATGMDTSSTATNYYVTVTGTGTNGSVKGKATAGSTTGIVAANDFNISEASTIAPTITDSGKKIYIIAGSITNNTTLPNGTTSSGTINRGSYIKINKGYHPNDLYYLAGNGTLASFTNGPSGGLTQNDYTDISNTAAAPILVSGDYLYINAGYTRNQKISLARLVPNDATITGEFDGVRYKSNSMLQDTSAYDKDGVLFTGSIETKNGNDLTASGKTVTVPAGYYAQQYTKDVASGTAGTPVATKGIVSNHSVSITPSVTNTTGYITGGTISGIAVTITASDLVSENIQLTQSTSTNVTNYATATVRNVNGSIGGTSSAGKADAKINYPNSMGNIATTEPIGTAETDYWEIKATATGTAGSYTPKYIVTTSGWINSTVNGTAQTVNVADDTTGDSIYIGKAAGSTTCSGGALTWTNGNATIVNSSTTGGVAIKVTRATVNATSKITTAGYTPITPNNDSFSTDSIAAATDTKYITGVTLENGNEFDITVPNGDGGTVKFHFKVANGNTTITSQ